MNDNTEEEDQGPVFDGITEEGEIRWTEVTNSDPIADIKAWAEHVKRQSGQPEPVDTTPGPLAFLWDFYKDDTPAWDFRSFVFIRRVTIPRAWLEEAEAFYQRARRRARRKGAHHLGGRSRLRHRRSRRVRGDCGQDL